MEELVNDYITMNQSGLVLALCEKYYDDNVQMFNNGTLFATSMKEAYEKQKGFVQSIKEFDVTLLSRKTEGDIEGCVAELIFHYKMLAEDNTVIDFTGKHTQQWKDGKIVREDYVSIDQA